MPKENLMADRGSLQLIGLVLAGVTAGVIFIVATLIYRSTDIQLANRPVSWQAEQTAVFHHT
jgi:Flp pilus assembly protein protease CpaA